MQAVFGGLRGGGGPGSRRSHQGGQFTGPRFTTVLKNMRACGSAWMGRGRWMDDVFIERLRRSLTYECIYWMLSRPDRVPQRDSPPFGPGRGLSKPPNCPRDRDQLTTITTPDRPLISAISSMPPTTAVAWRRYAASPLTNTSANAGKRSRSASSEFRTIKYRDQTCRSRRRLSDTIEKDPNGGANIAAHCLRVG